MEILLWLAFPAAATLAAMAWASWVGRPEREPSRAATDRARQRFAEAISKPLPAKLRRVPPPAPTDRSSGVAVRRTSPAARRTSPAARGTSPAARRDSAR